MNCILSYRPRYSAIDSDQEPLSYNDTQTLRADQKLEYPPPPKEELRSNGFPDSLDGNTNSAKPQFRQLHLDYGGGNNRTEAKAAMAEPQQATRIPTGHARRENRASLRAKHKRDMEQAQATGSKVSNSRKNQSCLTFSFLQKFNLLCCNHPPLSSDLCVNDVEA